MSEFRAHGANPEKLYKSFGVAMPERVIDFSTNTNALPWHGLAAFNVPELFSVYPDDDSSALRELLAYRNGCSPEEILVTNGSNEAIYLLASYCAAKVNYILNPVYGEYSLALAAWGADVKDIFSLTELGKDAEVLWLCNPCNPTGKLISADSLAEAARRSPQTTFIVDEAYIDFLTADEERLAFADLPKNMVVLRSLTKIYHLCGVRAGYVMAANGMIHDLQRRQPTWSVSSVAQAAASAFLRDEEYLLRTREFYRAETPRFTDKIKAAGFMALPTNVNFFLVEAGGDRQLIEFLLRRGLVVRHTRNFKGLDGKYIRVATRLPHENDMLADALREYRP